MLGGALLISYFGAGPLSLDAFINPEEPIEWFPSRRARREAS